MSARGGKIKKLIAVLPAVVRLLLFSFGADEQSYRDLGKTESVTEFPGQEPFVVFIEEFGLVDK